MNQKALPRQAIVLSPDPATLREISEGLKGVGIEPFFTNNLVEAIRKLGESNCQFFIADIRLQNPNALDVLVKLRQAAPGMYRALYLQNSASDVLHQALTKARLDPCGIFEAPFKAEDVVAFVDQLESRKQERKLSQQLGLSEEDTAQLELNYEARDMVREVARVMGIMIKVRDLRLPIFSWVAQSIQENLKEKEGLLDTLQHICRMDPGIAARILRDAHQTGAPPVHSIREALKHLDLEATRERVLHWAEEDQLEVRVEALQDIGQDLWVHSLTAAHGAEIMAQRMMAPNVDDYYLMGLLHDLGKWLIFELLEKGYRKAMWTQRMANATFIQELMDRYHTSLGARLLELWGCSTALRDVCLLHNQKDNLEQLPEAVLITYVSNMLTRRINASLKPANEEEIRTHLDIIRTALNVGADTLQSVEVDLQTALKQICFNFSLNA